MEKQEGHGGSEPATPAAHQQTCPPGYPSRGGDKGVGGVQSFLISSILLSRQQPNKLSSTALLFICCVSVFVCVLGWASGCDWMMSCLFHSLSQ